MDRRKHTIALESSFLDGGWTATCACGWNGERQDTMREASADSASHLDFEATRAAGETP